MAKIATTRLPDATPEYEETQFNALIRILEQITQQLNFGFQQDIKDESTARSWFRV
jgi:N-acetyl-anhydromuramyl-L-alanine amidase AmpD|tara:strand:- start:889 stop:1056 length:168 start_codon:yes stop_codon:yes gene_type:complete